MSSIPVRIGDRVANNDPSQVSYNWHGVIKGFHKEAPQEVVWVDWWERKQKDERGRPLYRKSCITARIETLRRI